MQSGCDAVLARMNRKYDSARYYESVQLLHGYFDRPAITTDLIVGFPGETEEEFQQTLTFLHRCAFAAMHIFPYSKRPDTPAAKMPGQVLNAVKEERARRAAETAAEMEHTYLSQWVGQTRSGAFRGGAGRSLAGPYRPLLRCGRSQSPGSSQLPGAGTAGGAGGDTLKGVVL